MADSIPAASVDEAASAGAGRRTSAIHEILREIARGGLAGLITGVLVGGVGGRLVMRLAALLVPEADGRFTENGNRIGAITLEGSLLLVLFGGVIAGVVAATIWVVAEPWLPAARRQRLLASVPLALAFGTPLLIEPDNPDFAILGHDPIVIVSLIVLIGIAGPVLVLVDAWLEAHLPAAGRGHRLASGAYSVVAVVGLLLTALLTVPVMIQVASPLLVIGLAGAGILTLTAWGERLLGHGIPTRLWLIGRGVLAATAIVGLLSVVPTVAEAFGLG